MEESSLTLLCRKGVSPPGTPKVNEAHKASSQLCISDYSNHEFVMLFLDVNFFYVHLFVNDCSVILYHIHQIVNLIPQLAVGSGFHEMFPGQLL